MSRTVALTVSADSGRFSNAAAVKLLLESPEWGRRGGDICEIGDRYRWLWCRYRFCGSDGLENVSKQTAWLLQHLNRTLFGDRGSEFSKIKCWKRCMIGRRVQKQIIYFWRGWVSSILSDSGAIRAVRWRFTTFILGIPRVAKPPRCSFQTVGVADQAMMRSLTGKWSFREAPQKQTRR